VDVLGRAAWSQLLKHQTDQFPVDFQGFSGKKTGFQWKILGIFRLGFSDWGFDWERIGFLMGIEWDMNEIE
jgi:hypothetical protein